MTRYKITRLGGTVVSICETCGETSGPQTVERRVEQWQRAHTAAHLLEEGRRMAASSVQATRRDDRPTPTPTPHPTRERAPHGDSGGAMTYLLRDGP